MFDTAKFGSYIASLRKAADMTQSELGDRLGLTRQAISRYECGESFPDVTVLGKLAEIFGVTVDTLIGSGTPSRGEARYSTPSLKVRTSLRQTPRMSSTSPRSSSRAS